MINRIRPIRRITWLRFPFSVTTMCDPHFENIWNCVNSCKKCNGIFWEQAAECNMTKDYNFPKMLATYNILMSSGRRNLFSKSWWTYAPAISDIFLSILLVSIFRWPGHPMLHLSWWNDLLTWCTLTHAHFYLRNFKDCYNKPTLHKSAVAAFKTSGKLRIERCWNFKWITFLERMFGSFCSYSVLHVTKQLCQIRLCI